MAKDLVFVDGVIAAKEKTLLKNKILKMCEGSAEEAFRTLSESGFFHGEEIDGVYSYERALDADAKDVDAFIREYAPSDVQSAYLLSDRDFHNAKALVKAQKLGVPSEQMLASDGLYSADEIESYIKGSPAQLPEELKGAIDEAIKLFEEQGEEASGAEVGYIFSVAHTKFLLAKCKRSRLLKKFIKCRADMTDVLTAMRSADAEYAEKYMTGLGNIKKQDILKLFSDDENEALHALDGTEMKEFYLTCLAARKERRPFTDAERTLAGADVAFLGNNRFELKREQPFLYYVFRRRAENENVRIVLSCLLAGMEEGKIKARLRCAQ